MARNIKNGPVTEKKLLFFNPGDKRFFTYPEEIVGRLGEISIKEKHEKVKVQVPSRLTTTILDTNTLSTNHPGGGMLAIGVDGFYTEVSISLLKSDTNKAEFLFEKEIEPVSYHTLSVLADIAKFKGKLGISVEKKSEEHIGLASNAMLSLSTAVAFNELLGRPFTNREIRKIIGYNYVEIVKTPSRKEPLGKLSYGINTGSSHAVGLYGGIILLTRDLEIVSHMHFPEDERILLYIPRDKKNKEISGNKEAERLFSYVRNLDKQQAQERVYRVFMELIPLMKQRKSIEIGNFLEDMLVQGHQQSLFSKVYSPDLQDTIRMFREQGANMCGISSGGPTIFATGKTSVLDRVKEKLINRAGADKNEIYLFGGSNGLEYLVDNFRSQRYKPSMTENA